MIDPIEQIAEARILEAIERGDLSNLSGEGKPLRIDDDSMIPEELRVAYRILKNAGFLPPELQLRKAIAEAEDLLLQVSDTAEHSRALARLQLLRTRLESSRHGRVNLRLDEVYFQKLLARMERKQP